MASFANNQSSFNCPLQLAIATIQGRWRALIMHHLGKGVDRFGALKRAIDGISERMLAQELRALQEVGLVKKTIFAEMPPRTSYELTDDGRALYEALQPMRQWGQRYKVDGS